jgi:hypothetical protein
MVKLVKARALYDVLPKISISNKANDNGIIKYHDWDEAQQQELPLLKVEFSRVYC